jgi:hypothetical protein
MASFTIRIEPTPGEGSTLSFTLPAALTSAEE